MSQKDTGYKTQRNYFETSHAKSEQDAARTHIKRRAAMAVVRNEAIIQSGHDLFEFLSKRFTKLAGDKVEFPQQNQFVSIP